MTILTADITNISFGFRDYWVEGWRKPMTDFIYVPEMDEVLDENRKVVLDNDIHNDVKAAYTRELFAEEVKVSGFNQIVADMVELEGYDHPLASRVFAMAVYYADGKPTADRHGSVDFYQVGRNATHDFYLAVDADGQLWKGISDDEGEWSNYILHDGLEGGYYGHL